MSVVQEKQEIVTINQFEIVCWMVKMCIIEKTKHCICLICPRRGYYFLLTDKIKWTIAIFLIYSFSCVYISYVAIYINP